MEQQQKISHQQKGEMSDEQVPKDLINRKISQLSDLQLRYTYSNASSASEFSLYQGTPVDQFECKYVRDDQLYSQLLEKIASVRNIVYIDHQDICLYLLQYYNWNEEKLSHLYFNQDWSNIINQQLQYSHGLIQKEGQCDVCLTQTALFSTGFCNHFYCRPCWISYIRQELLNGNIFSSCMNSPPCVKAPILKSFVDTIAPELIQLNRKKICINYAIQNKDICYCPNEKCPYFCIKPNMMQINTVICPCGQLYCYKCRKQPHHPVLCENVTRWFKLVNSQEANSSWIQNNTRQCPKCKQPIEKKVGCSHMKCICNCQFCYQCNKFWDQAHRIKKTECPHRDILNKKQKDQNKIAQLDSFLREIMKQAQKNKKLLMECENLIQDQTLQGRVVQLKNQVMSAWMTFKWTKIMLCLQNKNQVDQELQKQLIQSIQNVMEPIQIIVRTSKNLASKQLHQYGQQVLQRKEILKKNIRTWLDAWEYAME